jgi:hypothetical protein
VGSSGPAPSSPTAAPPRPWLTSGGGPAGPCAGARAVGSWLAKRLHKIHCQFITRVYDVYSLARKRRERWTRLTKGGQLSADP